MTDRREPKADRPSTAEVLGRRPVDRPDTDGPSSLVPVEGGEPMPYEVDPSDEQEKPSCHGS